jgi:hypothetical protein
MGEVLTTIAISPNGHQVAVPGRTCAGRPAVAVAALGEDRLVPWVLVEVPRPASSLSAPVRTAPGCVATLDFDAGRGHVLMQLVRPADPLVPVPLFRWDRHGAPKRIPVAAGVTNAQW